MALRSIDLMIGDWVHWQNRAIDPDIWLDSPIRELQGDHCHLEYGGGDPFYYDEIEPIPLTPEILERNGFVLQEKEAGMYGVTIAPHYTRDDLPFEIFCDGEPFAIWFRDPIDIAYVHQLQHALRLCKIDKEITI